MRISPGMNRTLASLCVAVALSAALMGLLATDSASAPPGATEPALRSGAPDNGTVFSELRMGILRHDHGFYRYRRESGTDLNVEALFRSPRWKPFEILFSPRPHLGMSASTDRKTSQFYTGFTWEWRPARDFFVDGSLGLALHDGFLRPRESGRAALGLRLLFRESLEVGCRFGAHHGVSAFLDHISNAGLGRDNDGITNMGGRYSYRFRRRPRQERGPRSARGRVGPFRPVASAAMRATAGHPAHDPFSLSG